MHPRLLQLGPVAVPTYGVLTALALLAALALASRLAVRHALDPQKVWNAGVIAVLTSFAGARLLLIAFHFRDFLAYPVWMLGLISLRGDVFMLSGIVLGICASFGYIFASRLPLRQVLDCAIPAVALGLSIQSLGCFFAGSDYGLPASLPWSVTYRSRIAALWYGTPLGIPLHPVQLYRALFYLLIVLLLVSAPLRRLQSGERAACGLFLSALGSSLLALFSAQSFITTVPGEAAAMAAILAAGVLWLRPAKS